MGLAQGARAHMEFHLKHVDPGSVLDLTIKIVKAMRSRKAKIDALRFDPRYTETASGIDGRHFKLVPVELVACAIVSSFMLKTFSPLLYLIPIGHRPDVLQGAVMVAAKIYNLPSRALVDWSMRLCTLSILGLSLDSFRSYASHIATKQNQSSPLSYIAAGLVKELSREDPQLTLDPAVAASATRPIILLSNEHWAFLIRSLVRGGDVESAKGLWFDMHNRIGHTPPLVQAAVIEGFASVKNFSRARAAWKAFASTEQTPAAVVYQAYLKALFLEGDSANAMAEFTRFEQNLRKYPEEKIRRDPAEVSVFNVVIEWLTSQRRADEVRVLLKRMKKMGPQPNLVSFNILMRHYRRTQNSQRITDIMREMVALGIHADIYTASIVLPAILHARTDAVQVVLTMLREDGVVVDRDAYVTLLRHLVRADDDASFDAAFAVLNHIENKEALVSTDTLMLRVVLEGIERRVWQNSALANRYRRAITEKLNSGEGQRRPTSSSDTSIIKLIDACCENPTLDALHRAIGYHNQHVQWKRRRKGHRLIFGRSTVILLGHLIRRNEWALADELVDALSREPGRDASPGLKSLIAQVRARDNRDEYLIEDEMAEWM
ncbi:hypothetical protein PsYK624_033720 [Phanerochaete sordida]|uniref:Pentacotripeptide-repeat region of PRORP domain-containing protein n=1 Tax=Phanerochaete sordida TaxID=48140 RepID=A0A9P3G474_9APHY|nr:hypothetical protein PsYK624_033720 [Phanerochaete sordida]